MSASQRDDVEYPYSPKPAAVLVPRGRTSEAVVKPRRSWRFVGKWLIRLAIAGAVLLAIITAPFAVVMYRARTQAALIADLERRGCIVEYSRDVLGYDWNDDLPELLRDWFGNDFASEVSNVSAMKQDGTLSPEDTKFICDACKRFPKLVSFSITSDFFTLDQVATWKQLDRLDHLGIESAKLTDDDLSKLQRMPRLTSLYLKAPRVTGAGLRHLAELPDLVSLSLDSAQMDGSGPANDLGLPHLTSLSIQNAPQLRDQGIINLGQMPELNHVFLDDTSVGDQAIAHLAASGKLSNVSLMRTHVTDNCLAALSNCPELSSLDLVGTQVTGATLALLAKCPDLTYLDVSETKATGKGFAGLACKELLLRMDNTAITDDGLHEVLQIPGLSFLSVQDTKVTGTGIKGFMGGPQLSLELAGAALTKDGIAALANSKLGTLGLARTPIDDKTLMLFAHNDDLSSLDVSQTKVTAQGVKAFYEARKARLTAAGKEESLYLTSDHPGIAEQYHPSFSIIGMMDDPTLLLPDGTDPPQDAPLTVSPN